MGGSRLSGAVCAWLGVLLWAACPGPGYPRCEQDRQCADRGEVCVYGACHACALDSHCAADKVCRRYRCEPRVQCQAATDCAEGLVCRDHRCAPECQLDSECAEGRVCKDRRCVDQEARCTADADCGEGLHCTDARCVPLPPPAEPGFTAEYGTPESPTSGVDPAGGRLLCGEELRVYFAYNESALSDESRANLARAATCLKASPALEVTVQGHTDERGATEYNLALGERRALAVRLFLRDLGVSERRLHLVSVGEERPLDPGHDEAAWARNRRAELYPRLPNTGAPR
ncbi:MAG: OmpA family protein [Deltaproteobacteria bacterium]|nr:OmpA family protein [Deltaproteobacteria bacterium]